MGYKIEIYRGVGHLGKLSALWYWRLLSRRGGKIIADGAEGYASRSNCLRAVRRLKMVDVAKVEAVIV